MAGRRMRWLASALVGALLAAGCGGGAADKAGGGTVVLRMATIDGEINGNGQLFGPEAFVEALERVSDGRIKVEVTTGYGDGGADAESRLVQAIASGDLDGGWPSTRAFAEAGIEGLEAVEAPMTITSYEAQAALASAPVATELLDQLDGSGIVGLGLAVGPLRRPFAREAALLSPEAWDGVTFRSYNSPVQEATIEALGGKPVNLGADWADAASVGEVAGVELDVAQYDANGLSSQAPFVAGNVVLWPKMFVLSISQKRFDALTGQQRGFVELAAREAVQASVEGPYDESSAAERLCDRGVRFMEAGAAQIDALREAVEPVIERLADDATSGPLLAQLQGIASEHPEADAVDVANSCRTTTGSSDSAIPKETSTLPDGVYRVEITPDEVADFGVSNGDGWSGTWTLRVREGVYELTCSVLRLPGRDCGGTNTDAVLEAGYVRGTGNTVYFVGDGEILAHVTGCLLPVSTKAGHCFVVDPYWMDWEVDGDHLTFSNPGGSDAYTLVIEPWTKIG